MDIDFVFRQLSDVKEIPILGRFLNSFSLNYPNYNDWVKKSLDEINMGYKEAILVFHERNLIGDLIYQKHKDMPNILELKNLRVDPNFRRRAIAYFLIKQSEHYANEEGKYDLIMGDFRKYHQDVEKLLLGMGFKQIGVRSLYDPNELDIIMVKDLRENKLRKTFPA